MEMQERLLAAQVARLLETLDNRMDKLENDLRRQRDALDARFSRLDNELQHQRELLTSRLDGLQKSLDDHEQRLRDATEGVTQFKLFAGLASGGSGLVALVALLRSFLGTP